MVGGGGWRCRRRGRRWRAGTGAWRRRGPGGRKQARSACPRASTRLAGPPPHGLRDSRGPAAHAPGGAERHRAGDLPMDHSHAGGGFRDRRCSPTTAAARFPGCAGDCAGTGVPAGGVRRVPRRVVVVREDTHLSDGGAAMYSTQPRDHCAGVGYWPHPAIWDPLHRSEGGSKGRMGILRRTADDCHELGRRMEASNRRRGGIGPEKLGVASGQ